MTRREEISEEQIRLLRRVFEREVQEIRDTVKISELERLIANRDTYGIIRLLNIDRSAFSDLEQTIEQAFRQGGVFTAADLSPIPVEGVGNVLFRFDMTTTLAAQWIADNAARFVVKVTEGQREMIREVITQGTNDGVNPRRQALDLVGRVNNMTGKREGGFIGLTSSQARSVQNARAELENLDSDYFNRELRDRRLDPAIRKAIKNDEPLPRKTINAAITSLQNRTLKYRGDNIARTEAINALRGGEAQAIAQAMEKGDIDPEDVTKDWSGSLDARERQQHLAIEKQRRNILEPFDMPDGSRLMYPGDTSLGAPGSQTINCRCQSIYRIDYFNGVVKRFKGFG